MKSARTNRWILLGACALVMAVSGFAWACTPVIHTSIGSVTPPGGIPAKVEPGAQVAAAPGSKLDLISLNGGSAPVEVRWNGADGPLLATSASGNMATSIQVPADEQPGVYFVVVVAKDPSGIIISKSSTTVSVTASPGTASANQAKVSSDLWSGLSGNPGSAESIASGTAPASSGSTSGIWMGAALVGVGALSLVSVLALGRAKRKRSAIG